MLQIVNCSKEDVLSKPPTEIIEENNLIVQTPSKGFACISITDTLSNRLNVPLHYSAIKHVEFSDFDPIFDNIGLPPEIAKHNLQQLDKKVILFDKLIALDILEFYGTINNQGIHDLIIHCERGISRSVAVALALYQVCPYGTSLGSKTIKRIEFGYNSYVHSILYTTAIEQELNNIENMLKKS